MLQFCYNTSFVFESFVKKKRILSQKNVSKKSVTQRRQKKLKQLLFCQKEKNFVLTKCKQKGGEEEERKKCSF